MNKKNYTRPIQSEEAILTTIEGNSINSRLKPLTIAFEGGEGAGKGTMIKRFEEYLNNHNIKFAKVREPGGMKISEEIRNVILDKENTNMNYLAEAYLYAASRAQLLKDIENNNKFNIEDKDLIIFDRSVYSSLTYQGYARGLGIELIKQINQPIGNYIDYVVLIQLDPEDGINRIMKHRSDEVNRLDLEQMSFHKKVQEGYNILKNEEPNKFIVINGNQSEENVFNDIIKGLKDKKII